MKKCDGGSRCCDETACRDYDGTGVRSRRPFAIVLRLPTATRVGISRVALRARAGATLLRRRRKDFQERQTTKLSYEKSHEARPGRWLSLPVLALGAERTARWATAIQFILKLLGACAHCRALLWRRAHARCDERTRDRFRVTLEGLDGARVLWTRDSRLRRSPRCAGAKRSKCEPCS